MQGEDSEARVAPWEERRKERKLMWEWEWECQSHELSMPSLAADSIQSWRPRMNVRSTRKPSLHDQTGIRVGLAIELM